MTRKETYHEGGAAREILEELIQEEIELCPVEGPRSLCVRNYPKGRVFFVYDHKLFEDVISLLKDDSVLSERLVDAGFFEIALGESNQIYQLTNGIPLNDKPNILAKEILQQVDEQLTLPL